MAEIRESASNFTASAAKSRESSTHWTYELSRLHLHDSALHVSGFFAFVSFSSYILISKGIAGDLYLVLHIEEKRGIQRDGLDLFSKVNVDYTEAILGTIRKVKIKCIRLKPMKFFSQKDTDT